MLKLKEKAKKAMSMYISTFVWTAISAISKVNTIAMDCH
jgi:hypothetical protein